MEATRIEDIAENILSECMDQDHAFELFNEVLEESADQRQLVEGFVKYKYDCIVPDNILDKFGLYDQVYNS
jgi:hypothetical protein